MKNSIQPCTCILDNKLVVFSVTFSRNSQAEGGMQGMSGWVGGGWCGLT